MYTTFYKQHKNVLNVMKFDIRSTIFNMFIIQTTNICIKNTNSHNY